MIGQRDLDSATALLSQYLLATSDVKFKAQSICRTRRELKVEHAPSSSDQLLAIFGAHHKVSNRQVLIAHASTNAVTR